MVTATASAEEFVERAGLYFERLGLSRTAGRLIGWLLVSEDGSADAPELCDAVGAAKSSTSVALRQLESAGLVIRYRPPRARRDRYRLADDVFGRAFRAKMAEFAAFHDLVEYGLQVVGDNEPARARLRRMDDMYGFLAREFPKLLDRWDRRAGNGGAA